jgi:murein DD-endopeptidase MepM/ murein hydrolase activator NlpD
MNLIFKFSFVLFNNLSKMQYFADRWTFSFNFARLLVILTMLVLMFYALVTGINFLGAYLLGGNNNSEETQQLVTLAAKVDSLQFEMEMKDQFIMGFKNMLEGGEAKRRDTINQKVEKLADVKISKEEEEFRKKFEKEVTDPSYRSVNGFNLLYFSAPVTGKVTDLVQSGNTIGLLIEADKDKTVKSLDAGIVVLNIQNADSTCRLIIQHKTGLLTIYDRLKRSLVSTGTTVDKGTDIAPAAEQKVVFSMIYNGKLLNPRQYISWNK